MALPRESAERRRSGAYFTPAPLVRTVLEHAAHHVPAHERLAVVDPACGAGAFLAAAKQRFPQASLHGLELSPTSAATCRERVGFADVDVGDALRGGLDALLSRIPQGAFELWVGNPPYNGTSPVLADKQAYARLLPSDFSPPRGTSLRDDFAFFLLLAALRLQSRRGVLAFITSATLLDAFLYAPMREALLRKLHLREVIDLGAGAFANTKVKTCITVWTSPGPTRGTVRYQGRGFADSFTPAGPEYLLRPTSTQAQALDDHWRATGEPLSQLVPVSFPGLKTRFDELLVDEDPQRLLARIGAFLAARPKELARFAQAHRIPDRHWEKLRTLHAQAPRKESAEAERVRPFFRYAGARHRGTLPPEARAYCYLDRRLIPRGDHRLRGAYDPHAGTVKLVFNTRELPLAAALLEEAGCVHDHRHARFAPLLVPERILTEGLGVTRRGNDFGPLVPNLSPRARGLGEPLEVFRALVRFINSAQVQEVWAPAFGASRELPVPLDALMLK
ncbi:MAG: N-6 DNA methylase [Myxococcota bacterium]